MLQVLPALSGCRFSRPDYNKYLISWHSCCPPCLSIYFHAANCLLWAKLLSGQVIGGSEFGATTTCESPGMSSAALLHLCCPGLAVPASPAVPELHIMKWNWKQQCVFLRIMGPVMHCWSRAGEEEGADGDRMQVFLPGWSLNLSPRLPPFLGWFPI